MSMPSNQQPTAAHDPQPRRLRLALAATALVLAALALWWFVRSGPEVPVTPPQGTVPAAAPPNTKLALTPAAPAAIPHALRSPEPAAQIIPGLPPGRRLGGMATVDDPDWENGILDGRLALHTVVFDHNAMRGDLTGKILDSDRFAEWVAKVPTAATDHALARDYAEMVRRAAAAVPGEWTPPRTACSDRICLLWFQGGPKDERAWMSAFGRTSGRLSRVLTVQTIPLPNDRFEYRYAIAVDPTIIASASLTRMY